MTEEEFEFRLMLSATANKLAYAEWLRLTAKYGDNDLNKISIGVRCAIDYILDNYDLKPKAKADGEPRIEK